MFISHKSEEHALAQRLCDALEEAGIRCWIAPRDIPAASNYAQIIPTAIDASHIFLLVLTEAAQTSEDVHIEIELAKRAGCSRLPVRIDDCVLVDAFRYLLALPQWLDMSSTQPELRFEELISSVRLLLDARSGANGSPPNAESQGRSPADPRPTSPPPWTEELKAGGREIIVTIDEDSAAADDLRRWFTGSPSARRFATSSWVLSLEEYKQARDELHALAESTSEQ